MFRRWTEVEIHLIITKTQLNSNVETKIARFIENCIILRIEGLQKDAKTSKWRISVIFAFKLLIVNQIVKVITLLKIISVTYQLQNWSHMIRKSLHNVKRWVIKKNVENFLPTTFHFPLDYPLSTWFEFLKM